MNIQALLLSRFAAAVAAVGAPADSAIPLTRSTRAEFGEYQFNGAMALAKVLRKKPRDIAEQLVAAVDLEGIAETIEIAGPGFINIHLATDWLNQQIPLLQRAASLAAAPNVSQTVVVDYSSPNLAKEMHVGHLRSTIIGDAVVRVLEFLGHTVIRQNHMGDWGTQFGMLLAHFSDKLAAAEVAETALSDLEDFYREAKVRFDQEPEFAQRARAQVVKLQSGDAHCMALWQQFIDISIAHSEAVYRKLNVTLTRADVMGESAYNEALPGVIESLTAQGIAVEDQGARVVFIDEMQDKQGQAAVYIVQKSDGGYLYSTTDLAAMQYRAFELGADRNLIFTDARQALHFKQTEIVGRRAGFYRQQTSYEHCPFGMMLGADGKPFKTRTGDTIKLVELLDEAIERAGAMVAQRNPDLPADERQRVARIVGIGAVKYADLSKNRTTDYVFNWDTMLSFEGNTAPYLQYAYTRVVSIFRKAGVEQQSLADQPVVITAKQERALAVKLVQFTDTVLTVASDATPHVLCGYLYELASAFMSFYEACPMLNREVPAEIANSRLLLASATAKTLHTGLDLLGIETLEKM